MEAVKPSRFESHLETTHQDEAYEQDESKRKAIIEATKLSDPVNVPIAGVKDFGAINCIRQHPTEVFRVTLSTDKGIQELLNTKVQQTVPFQGSELMLPLRRGILHRYHRKPLRHISCFRGKAVSPIREQTDIHFDLLSQERVHLRRRELQ